MKQTLSIFALLCGLGLAQADDSVAQTTRPVVTDSRVKTIVYNENDVYSLLTHYGYQSNIEFHPKERIQTVVLGDRVNWQIIPSGRRIFIRPLEENLHTNMTVVTTERSYQFDLRSNDGGPLRPDEELVYVVRFYYPEDDAQNLPAAYAGQLAPQTLAMPAVNYRYSFTGPDALAPQKISDDGQTTTLLLTRQPDAITLVTPDGREVPVNASALPDGSTQVSVVAPRLTLHYGSETVQIFNEAY